MRFFKAAALMFASMLGLSSTKANASKNTTINANEINRIPSTSFVRGGYHGDAKSYGQIVGTGGTKKSNRLRYSHNAKLKRRMA